MEDLYITYKDTKHFESNVREKLDRNGNEDF